MNNGVASEQPLENPELRLDRTRVYEMNGLPSWCVGDILDYTATATDKKSMARTQSHRADGRPESEFVLRRSQ